MCKGKTMLPMEWNPDLILGNHEPLDRRRDWR
jgi:hypothetical protein